MNYKGFKDFKVIKDFKDLKLLKKSLFAASHFYFLGFVAASAKNDFSYVSAEIGRASCRERV